MAVHSAVADSAFKAQGCVAGAQYVGHDAPVCGLCFVGLSGNHVASCDAGGQVDPAPVL